MDGVAVAAGAIEPPGRKSFTDASPREIRAALIPEEQLQFDKSWRATMTRVAGTQDLGEVFSTLAHWRTHAEITQAPGHHGHRQMLARAERIERTGELPPDTVPSADFKALNQERLGK